jgi:hypothetical protein
MLRIVLFRWSGRGDPLLYVSIVRNIALVQRRTSTKGFKRTATLLGNRIRMASESRGFAQSRLLTNWAEIAGPDISSVARPVEVSYSRGGMGATLTLLTTGAQAPMLEMQKEQIRAKVNSVYGYNAIARVRITQTATTGFAEGQVDFTHRPKSVSEMIPDAGIVKRAAETTQAVGDEGLRTALERLGANVMKQKTTQT